MTEVLSAMPPMPTFPHPPSSQSDRIREIPQFAFPIRPMDQEAQDTVLSNSRLEIPSVQSNRSHRRARTSVNVTPPLPSFSFGGPTTVSPTSATSTTPPAVQPIFSQGLSPSTPPSRHRRAVSEFGGGDGQSDAAQQPASQPLPTMPRPHVVHRHRRSGAVDSQDLSALRIGRSLGTEQNQPAILTSGADASNNADSPSDPSPSTSQGSPQSSSRSVTFSDVVIKHNPRSVSVESSDNVSSQSTMYGTVVASTSPLPAFSFPNTLPPSPSPASEPDDEEDSSDPFISSGLHQDSSTGVDIVELDQNFDHDPTEAVTGDHETSPYLAYEHADFTEPSASPSKNTSSPTSDSHSAEIDLDFASLDYKPASATAAVRGVSFQRARASMHSAGSQSGTLATSLASHRRAESAPSLPTSPFQLRSIDNAAEAGFEMTAVFEEDEDDDEADEAVDTTPQATPDVGNTTKADFQPVEQEASPNCSTGKRDINASPTLLPPFQYIVTQSTSHDDSDVDCKSAESSNSPQQSSLVTLEDQSVSAKSSPNHAQGAVSSYEPSPSTSHRSVDDVPSLISSGSTAGETTLANPSIKSLDPNVAVTGSTTSLAPPTRPTHRKRHSIMIMSGMSMSMSRLFPTTSSQSGELDTEPSHRSQSTAGLEPPKPSKARRVMQKLGLRKKRVL